MRGAWVLILAAAFTLSGCYFSDETKIGVVDVAKVINESDQGRKANTELENLIKSKQGVISEKAAAVDQARKELEKVTDAAARKTKETELGRITAEYQNMVNTSQAEIQKKATELKNSVIGDIKQITDDIAAAEKFTVVLTTDAAFSFQKSIDITVKVLKKYDESKK